MTVETNNVPVTNAFVSLVYAIQAARTMYINETHLAEELGFAKPEDYFVRCQKLFYVTYVGHVKAIGLRLNEITFRSILDLKLPEEVLTANVEDLPNKFVFDPWLGQGKGGIKPIEA